MGDVGDKVMRADDLAHRKIRDRRARSFVIPIRTRRRFQLPNPKDAGRLAYYDDCRRTTGMMADAKGPGYDQLLTFDITKESVIRNGGKEWWFESGRQIVASDGRSVRWYFAELGAALEARHLFDGDSNEGRRRIEVVFLPRPKGGRQ